MMVGDKRSRDIALSPLLPLSSPPHFNSLSLQALATHFGLDATPRMSISVFVAHTGARLDADPTAFESLDSLRSGIANATSILLADQIFLTKKGRHVKLPHC